MRITKKIKMKEPKGKWPGWFLLPEKRTWRTWTSWTFWTEKFSSTCRPIQRRPGSKLSFFGIFSLFFGFSGQLWTEILIRTSTTTRLCRFHFFFFVFFPLTILSIALPRNSPSKKKNLLKFDWCSSKLSNSKISFFNFPITFWQYLYFFFEEDMGWDGNFSWPFQ